jgi:hypothetical protein
MIEEETKKDTRAVEVKTDTADVVNGNVKA